MKKIISLALALLLIYTCNFAEGLNDTDKYQQLGFVVGDVMEPSSDNENMASFSLSKDTSTARVRYLYNEDRSQVIAGDINYMPKETKTRQEYIAQLSAIINAEQNYEKQDFYNLAIAFISKLSNNNVENAKSIFRQILAQNEINSYFPDSPMQSYVDNKKGTENFDTNVDSKNPVYDGKKFYLRINKDGIILSFINTDDKNTIELISKEDSQKEIVINKQYSWDSMVAIMDSLLEKGFVLEQDPVSISMPLEKLEDNTVKLICTGTGVMLTQGQIYKTYRLADTENSSITYALKFIANKFNTLNSYAKMAGVDGLQIIAYFDDGEKVYTSSNITDFIDLLTNAIGETILLEEDQSKPTSDEDLENAVNKEAPDTISINQDTNNEQAAETTETTEIQPTLEPENNNDAEIDANKTEESIVGKQIEITKKLVNIRQTPGGKVIFRLKRGKVAELISEEEKLKGFTWYNIKVDDKEGWVRGDTAKILDYIIESTPEPSDDNSSENIEIINSKYKALGRSSKGNSVKLLQERLLELGYTKAKPDGKFGGKTENAVKQAQKAFNMQMTGIADEAFQEKLFSDNATTAIDASMSNLKPETMTLDIEELKKAEKTMKNLYFKQIGDYNTGVTLSNQQNSYSLIANAVDSNTSNYEISISFNDAEGAAQIDPKFIIKVLNLHINNIEKIELIHGKNAVEIAHELWTQEGGLVVFDITKDKTVLENIMDKRVTQEIKFSNASESFSINMDSKSGPHLITKYMSELWKKLSAQSVADAAQWQNAQ